jgi:crossover junction endodeoxyribonuclease RuvC
MRILGIDPGSRITGYGVIQAQSTQLALLACGTIRTGAETDFSKRLLVIFTDLCEVIQAHKPDVAAVEEIFLNRNPSSTLKLGHARGVAMIAALQSGIEVFDYTALRVKQAVAGYGKAEKSQVQYMVRTLLGLNAAPSSDAADALAVAICHAHHLARNKALGATTSRPRIN